MDQLEIDQADIFGRLLADEYLSDVAVLLQANGVTDTDIDVALGTLNAGSGGKIGAVLIVLMPILTAPQPAAPGPMWKPKYQIQIIDQPMFNTGTGGTGKSASQLAERTRQILHNFPSSSGSYFTFEGQESFDAGDGKNSFIVSISRLGGDNPPVKCGAVTFAPNGGASPQLLTLASATAGAAIWYTVDGSYPGPTNGTLYTVPFNVTSAKTVRAAASKAGLQQSNPTAAIFT